MIKNVVFDMGNVLLRFDRDVFLDAVGAEGEDRKLLLNNVYLSVEWARMDRGSMTEPEAAESMCRHLPARLHETAHRLVDRWDRPILPVAGMEKLCRDLKKAGYGVYLLSNASYRQHEYWPRVPGSDCFDGTLISADVKFVKPEPEIYRLLYRKFSLNPEECVFIDDATANIEGAERTGMVGIVFHNDAGEVREKLRELGVAIEE